MRCADSELLILSWRGPHGAAVIHDTLVVQLAVGAVVEGGGGGVDVLAGVAADDLQRRWSSSVAGTAGRQEQQ